MTHEQAVRAQGHSDRLALGVGHVTLVIFTLNIFVLLTSKQTTHKKASKAKNEKKSVVIAIQIIPI